MIHNLEQSTAKFTNKGDKLANKIKYNYKGICASMGYRYVLEKNPYIFVEDSFGFTHKITRTNLAKGCRVGFKSVCGDKTEYFKKLFEEKHGDQSNLFSFRDFKYTKSLDYTEVECVKHGKYKTKPNWILSRGHHCEKCSDENRNLRGRDCLEDFISKATLKHGDTYDYSNVDYTGCRNPIKIGCKEHGNFDQIPYYHLAGNGCPECGEINGGYSASDYEKVCPNGSNLYLLKLTNNQEMFYKIGISKDIADRMREISRASGYKVELVEHCFHQSAKAIYSIERLMHKLFLDFKYSPKSNFQGHTECFSYIDKEEFVQLFNYATKGDNL